MHVVLNAECCKAFPGTKNREKCRGDLEVYSCYLTCGELSAKFWMAGSRGDRVRENIWWYCAARTEEFLHQRRWDAKEGCMKVLCAHCLNRNLDESLDVWQGFPEAPREKAPLPLQWQHASILCLRQAGQICSINILLVFYRTFEVKLLLLWGHARIELCEHLILPCQTLNNGETIARWWYESNEHQFPSWKLNLETEAHQQDIVWTDVTNLHIWFHHSPYDSLSYKIFWNTLIPAGDRYKSFTCWHVWL